MTTDYAAIGAHYGIPAEVIHAMAHDDLKGYCHLVAGYYSDNTTTAKRGRAHRLMAERVYSAMCRSRRARQQRWPRRLKALADVATFLLLAVVCVVAVIVFIGWGCSYAN